MKRITFWGTLTGFGFLLSTLSGALAEPLPQKIAVEMSEPSMDAMQHATEDVGQFQRIEQPLSRKVAVTLGGIGLIGLELWWFLFSRSKPQKASITGNIQQVTVKVDGGYDPSRIVVQVGQPVQLRFDRQDPSSCLESVRLPDFQIAQDLPLNQVTAIEFTPTQPGTFIFTCGMNMFRGEIQVEAAEAKTRVPTAAIAPTAIV